MTTRGHVFLGAGVCVGIVGIVLGLHDLTKVGTLLIVLPLLASLITRRDLAIEVSRVVAPARVRADEHADVTVSVHNRGRRTTPLLRGEEHVAHALGDRPHLLIPRLEGGVSRELTYRVRTPVRGHHPIGPLSVRVTDPFSLATRAVTVPGENSLIVLPRVVPLTPARGGPAGGGGETSSIPQMALHGEESVGVREYRVGDDLRRVHWRSTARTGETMVRQDEHPARRRALVVLDDRASVHAGTGGGSFEWSVTAAASIITVLLGEQFEVHLRLSCDATSWVAPVEGLESALDELAAVQPAPTTSARGIVDALADFGEHGGGLVVGIFGALEPQIADLCTASTGRGLALVIDREGFHGSDRERAIADEHGPAQESSQRLALCGWHVQVVRPGDELARLWAALTVGARVRS